MRLVNRLQCGNMIPDFSLPDTDGTIFSKEQLLGTMGLCIMFLSDDNHYVLHIRDVLLKLINEFQLRGLSAAAIYPAFDSASTCVKPTLRESTALEKHPFPCLVDTSRNTTRHFGVTRIPDFFLFNRDGILLYHGRMDESKPENCKPVTGRDLREALNALLLGQTITLRQRPGFGTPIKWK